MEKLKKKNKESFPPPLYFKEVNLFIGNKKKWAGKRGYLQYNINIGSGDFWSRRACVRHTWWRMKR